MQKRRLAAFCCALLAVTGLAWACQGAAQAYAAPAAPRSPGTQPAGGDSLGAVERPPVLCLAPAQPVLPGGHSAPLRGAYKKIGAPLAGVQPAGFAGPALTGAWADHHISFQRPGGAACPLSLVLGAQAP